MESVEWMKISDLYKPYSRVSVGDSEGCGAALGSGFLYTGTREDRIQGQGSGKGMTWVCGNGHLSGEGSGKGIDLYFCTLDGSAEDRGIGSGCKDGKGRSYRLEY